MRPRGWGGGKGTHLGVYLQLVGGDAIDATWDLAVVGPGKVKKELGVLGQNGEPFFWAFKPGDDWGYDKFLALDEIEKGG